MTTFTNITTRKQFLEMLDEIRTSDIMPVDTESNGLRWYNDHFIISISLYLPKYDHAWNIPFYHGVGAVDIDYNNSNSEGMLFADMNWSGKTKKQLYLQYWFNQYSKEVDFGNLPIAWMEELKQVWTIPTHVYHNAKFDLHMLERAGFPRPNKVIDTMVVLHIVNEDWGGVEVDAPFQWTEKDRSEGLCPRDYVGQWAYTNDGSLRTKRQRANRELKWSAAFAGIPYATKGEEVLYKAIRQFEDNLARYIFENHLHHPYNEGLVYKSKKMWETDEQYQRIREKISLDTKANLWMLPAADIAFYAMVDVVITWGLYQHWLPTIKAWDNLELLDGQCELLYRLAWQMEHNGVLLDVDNARQEIERLDPLIVEFQERFNWIAHTIGYGKDVNIGSWQQLLPFLNWENEAGFAPLELSMGYDVLPASYVNEDRIAGIEHYDHARPKSTEHDVLEAFEGHPIIMMIFEYRKMKKSSDTYLKNWLSVRDKNGYVHAGMNSLGTVSGRWSSGGDGGNWQNIPERNGYQVKRAVVTPSDWLLIGVDYGQLEARLAAYIAEFLLVQLGVHSLEPTMLRLFNEGVDMHAFTRDTINVREVVFPNMTERDILYKLGYSLDVLQVSADSEGKDLETFIVEFVAAICRQIAKTLNFGLLYNGTKYMASTLLRVPLEVADVLVQAWRKLFPVFAIANDYFTEQAMTWRQNPTGTGMAMYVTQPISNRHRKVHKYTKWQKYQKNGIWKGFNPQEASSQKVWNNIVQGLGGYICTMSGLSIVNTYGNDIVRWFANIHDALDGYISLNHLDKVQGMLNIMTDWDTNPRLTVDLSASVDGTWQSMKPVKNMGLWVASRGQEGYKK